MHVHFWGAFGSPRRGAFSDGHTHLMHCGLRLYCCSQLWMCVTAVIRVCYYIFEGFLFTCLRRFCLVLKNIGHI